MDPDVFFIDPQIVLERILLGNPSHALTLGAILFSLIAYTNIYYFYKPRSKMF